MTKPYQIYKPLTGFSVQVEATDLADAEHLRERVASYLETLEHGDWMGRRVIIAHPSVRVRKRENAIE